MKPVKLPLPARGLDLLSNETRLAEGAVRAADNVDIRRNGTFKRRQGYAVHTAGPGFHGLYNSPGNGPMVVRDTKVYLLVTDDMLPLLMCDMGSDAPVDFTEYNGQTYIANERSLWRISAGTRTARPVGVAGPNPLPTIEATDFGTLTAGRYAVAVSRLDDTGEESHTTLLGTVEVPTGGGVRLSGFTVDLSCSYRVYLSPPNGDALYLAETFSGAFPTYVVSRQPDGAIRTTQHLRPMPAGQFIRSNKGRIYVASGDTLWFSEPLRPHLCDIRHNFIPFVGRIRFIESVDGGVFVADDRGVWFVAGADSSDARLVLASPVLAVARSSLTLTGAHFNREVTGTESDVAVWLSEQGYMLGRPSGDVVSLHPERIRVAAGLEGRSVFLVRDGIKQIITLIAATPTSAYGVAIDTPQEQ